MQRRASNSGIICVALQKVALGRVHAARKTITVEVTDTQLRVHCDDGIRNFAPHQHQTEASVSSSTGSSTYITSHGRPTIVRPKTARII